MASYYYLMSSLPMLRADGEMPFHYDEFLEKCRSSLKEPRYQLLKELTLSSSEGPLLSEWSRFYGVLERELIYQRRQRLGQTCTAPTDRDADAVRIVAAAMNESNPLEAEKMLLELEFEKLDTLVNMHYFDDAALIGYALKLKLLERKTVFDNRRGKAEFGRIVEYLQQQILSM